MSKKRRNVGNLAALGGAALLAMKLAKGNRKDAAPIETRDTSGKKEGKPSIAASISDDMRKRAQADTAESGIGQYARETGIGTMRQPARDVSSRSTPARAPAARTAAPAASPAASPAAAPAASPAASPAAAPSISSMMSNVGARPSFGITPGREVDPNVLRAMQRAGGMKKGGTVKKKSGGMVSKASKRADGCAVKGKTRGRMV